MRARISGYSEESNRGPPAVGVFGRQSSTRSFKPCWTCGESNHPRNCRPAGEVDRYSEADDTGLRSVCCAGFRRQQLNFDTTFSTVIVINYWRGHLADESCSARTLLLFVHLNIVSCHEWYRLWIGELEVIFVSERSVSWATRDILNEIRLCADSVGPPRRRPISQCAVYSRVRLVLPTPSVWV
jgi:hypothetical protein